jgi:hypothetical protein
VRVIAVNRCATAITVSGRVTTDTLAKAAAYFAAADEELMSERIAEQEKEVKRLMKQRDELLSALQAS